MRFRTRCTALAAAAVCGLGLAASIPATASAAPGAAVSPTAATTQLWASRLHLKDTAGSAITASADGSTVFAAGTRQVTIHADQAVAVAYNPDTGAMIWQNQYAGAVTSAFYAAAAAPNGSMVFAAGSGNLVKNGMPEALTVAYDAATGAVAWTQATGKRGVANSIAVSPDGSTVFVTGYDNCGKPANHCYLTSAYSAATGAVLWSQEMPNGGLASHLAVSPDGSAVYVTGQVFDAAAGYSEYETTAYDAATGATLWTASDDAPGNASPVGLGVSPDGSQVFVAGVVTLSTGSDEYRTIAYNAATGAQEWTQSFANMKQGDASGLAVSPDGSMVYVTGIAGVAHSTGYGTVAYNASTGAVVWKALLGSQAGGLAVAVNPDGGKVYVTGYEGGRFGTLAYDASTGHRLWTAHYGTATDEAATPYGLAVSPDGSKVFVTGQNLDQLATVAYSG